jgi:hypothetical protein
MRLIIFHDLLELEEKDMMLHKDFSDVAEKDLVELIIINCLCGGFHHLFYDEL